jgi:hypothetical protein
MQHQRVLLAAGFGLGVVGAVVYGIHRVFLDSKRRPKENNDDVTDDNGELFVQKEASISKGQLKELP